MISTRIQMKAIIMVSGLDLGTGIWCHSLCGVNSDFLSQDIRLSTFGLKSGVFGRRVFWIPRYGVYFVLLHSQLGDIWRNCRVNKLKLRSQDYPFYSDSLLHRSHFIFADWFIDSDCTIKKIDKAEIWARHRSITNHLLGAVIAADPARYIPDRAISNPNMRSGNQQRFSKSRALAISVVECYSILKLLQLSMIKAIEDDKDLWREFVIWRPMIAKASWFLCILVSRPISFNEH